MKAGPAGPCLCLGSVDMNERDELQVRAHPVPLAAGGAERRAAEAGLQTRVVAGLHHPGLLGGLWNWTDTGAGAGQGP